MMLDARHLELDLTPPRRSILDVADGERALIRIANIVFLNYCVTKGDLQVWYRDALDQLHSLMPKEQKTK